MLRNYIKIAFRHLLRHKLITVINISGLAIGMACFILILMFVRDELSYDRFHVNKDNIFRLNTVSVQDGKVSYGSSSQVSAAPALKQEVSGVKDAVRVMHRINKLVVYNDKRIVEEDVVYADEGFFQMFSFPLKAGNAATALKEPYTVVLTESMAGKYFGNADPIGKMVRIQDEFDCKVTAVAKDLPSNTDVKGNIFISFNTYEQQALKAGVNLSTRWGWFSDNVTYVQLRNPSQLAGIQKSLKPFTDLHMGEITKQFGFQFAFKLQPLQHIHLHPDGDDSKVNDVKMVYIYIAIAVFIILIACINFMNLVTARANERLKEVGLRKVMGAQRRALVGQFLTEAALLSLIAFLIALIMAQAALPAFNNIADKSLQLFSWQQAPLLGFLLLIALTTGLLAGSYPAFYLSGFAPMDTLKSAFRSFRNKSFTRRVLVVSQFSIAIILIVATIVVYTQLRYWQQKNLGFDKEHLLNIYLSNGKDQLTKDEMLRLPGVKHASLSNIAMGKRIGAFNPIAKEADTDDKSIVAGVITGDFDLVKTFGMQLVQGRDFSSKLSTDSSEAFIINEAAAKALGLINPLGSRIEWRPGGTVRKGKVIGVVKDFNFSSLQEQVKPIIYFIQPQDADVLTLRLQPGNLYSQMKEVSALWTKLEPVYPLQYSFVGDDLSKQYLREQRLGQLFGIFAALSIFIACMGLLGLSVLIARQRTKEIGIRKVLGASVANITVLLSGDFLKLVLVALVIATPAAWYIMSKWLEDFAYRIHIEWWMFALAGFAAILIALCTISFQSVKAALTNPVRSLRTE
jgi:putative ABC transport system permease protein